MSNCSDSLTGVLEPLKKSKWEDVEGCLRVEYVETKDDLIDFFYWNHLQGLTIWTRIRSWTFLGIVLAICILFVGVLPREVFPKKLSALPEVIFKLIAILIGGYVVLVTMFAGRKTFAKQFENECKRNPDFFKETRVRASFSEQGCLSETPARATEHPWGTISQIVQTDSVLYVFDNGKINQIRVPRRAFETDRAFDEFCQRVQSLLQSSRNRVEEETNPVLRSSQGIDYRRLSIAAADQPMRPLLTRGEWLGLFGIVWISFIVVCAIISWPVFYFMISKEYGLPPLPRGILIGAGVVSALTIAGLVVWERNWDGMIAWKFFRHISRERLDQREDRIVDPSDPAAIFVQRIPRENWIRFMMERSTDRGWLKIDAQKRAVLFEGVRERWVIPYDTITSCTLMEYSLPEFHNGKPSQYVFVSVLLVISNGQISMELPLNIFEAEDPKRRNEIRREQAESLRQRICALI